MFGDASTRLLHSKHLNEIFKPATDGWARLMRELLCRSVAIMLYSGKFKVVVSGRRREEGRVYLHGSGNIAPLQILVCEKSKSTKMKILEVSKECKRTLVC